MFISGVYNGNSRSKGIVQKGFFSSFLSFLKLAGNPVAHRASIPSTNNIMLKTSYGGFAKWYTLDTSKATFTETWDHKTFKKYKLQRLDMFKTMNENLFWVI